MIGQTICPIKYELNTISLIADRNHFVSHIATFDNENPNS